MIPKCYLCYLGSRTPPHIHVHLVRASCYCVYHSQTPPDPPPQSPPPLIDRPDAAAIVQARRGTVPLGQARASVRQESMVRIVLLEYVVVRCRNLHLLSSHLLSATHKSTACIIFTRHPVGILGDPNSVFTVLSFSSFLSSLFFLLLVPIPFPLPPTKPLHPKLGRRGREPTTRRRKWLAVVR